MRLRTLAPLTALVSGLGVAGLLAVGSLVPEKIALGLFGAVVCWIAFTLWPWSILPGVILGGTLAAALAGLGGVGGFVAVHMGVLVLGAVALATRWRLGMDRHQPVPSFDRRQVTLVLGVAFLGAVYGLVLAHDPQDVVVATYQVAVLPLYFLAAVTTLRTPQQRRYAAVLYIGSITLLSAVSLATPGRHGGLLSLLPLPLLIVLTGRARGWKQAALALVATVLIADVVLSAYRGVWIAAALAVVILAGRGGPDVRRGLAAIGLAGGTLFMLLGLSVGVTGGLESRAAVVNEALGRSAGYRVSESEVGFDVFADHPLFGAGLGQSTPGVNIPGFTVTDVGPVYHSFYIALLANIGMLGLAVVMWPIARTIWAAVRTGEGVPLAFAALTCGFLAAAAVSSPTDGHWELGLLPALTLLTLPAGAVAARRPQGRGAGAPVLRPGAAR